MIRTDVHPSGPAGPELPAWKAFVVQFSREAGTSAGTFAGRLEHLSWGRRSRFHSAEEPVTTLEKLIAEIADPSGSAE